MSELKIETLYERERARRDASFVLDWLDQTGAPENIVGLQKRAVEALGGYADVVDRAEPWRPKAGSLWGGLGSTLRVIEGEGSDPDLVPCLSLRGRSGQLLLRPTKTQIHMRAFVEGMLRPLSEADVS